jgi:phospholipase/lecithinase/hemolysin
MKFLFACFIFVFSGLVGAKSLNDIVVFGDSLSDNGNLYEYMHQKLPQSPPYHEGRFTNGPIWVERLVEFYFPTAVKEHLFDYAFGGAGISENPEDDLLFTLKREIDTYFLAHDAKADENSLYIVWIGANNYLGIPDNPDQVLNAVDTGITHGLQRLANAGAKHVMVVNLPDLGKLPFAHAFKVENELSYFSSHHNNALEASISELQSSYPDVQWLYFDINNVFSEVLISPQRFGFNNISDTCYDVTEDSISKKSVLHMAAKMESEPEDVCEGFMFFDPVHPTALVHQLMAEQAKSFLEASGIQFNS